MIFKENNKAIYLQIADRIMDSVLAGTYLADDRIPSVREYAADVEVNANTVMRTYDYLQQQGIVYNRRGIGFFIAPDARRIILEMRRAAFFGEEMDFFFSRLKSLGIDADTLSDLYREYCNEPQSDEQ